MKRSTMISSVLMLAVAGYGIYAGLDFRSRHSEARLLERANTYWGARVVNDLATAYELEAEAVSGNLLPHEVKKGVDYGVRLTGYEVGTVSYYEGHAEVQVKLQVTWPDSKTQTRWKPAIKDLWTFTHGQWFHGAPEKGGAGIRDRSPEPKGIGMGMGG
jgi:hypothetical protein